HSCCNRSPSTGNPGKETYREAAAAGAAAKKPQANPTHPKTSEMAIKKYIAVQYKVDALAPFIRRYLKSAVESGTLIQTKARALLDLSNLNQNLQRRKIKNQPAVSAAAAVAAVAQKPAPAAKKAAAQGTATSAAAPKAQTSAKPPTKNPHAPTPKKAAAAASAGKASKPDAKKASAAIK
ncbi:histone H1C-like, partial [Manduca sexta]|uniref:histone H1C-like n=1 Tax=Manduca sexta TaxID=7130 RepID=UPI00188F445D